MEQIFPEVYRFGIGKRVRAFSYLLIREQGNVLICHANRGSSVVEFLDEIEELGGIKYQLVTEGSDVSKSGLHEQLYDRFGCMIHCHERDRKKITRKTACPIAEFGEDGIELGSDLTSIDIGHVVYHWKTASGHFLFPGHAIELEDGGWHIHLHPFLDYRSALMSLADRPVDFLLPSRAVPSDEAYHSFSDDTRHSYHQALRAALRPTKKSLQTRLQAGEHVTKQELESSRPCLISNYISPHMVAVIDELETFDTHIMPGGATGKIDILLNCLELADTYFFHDFNRKFVPSHEFWGIIRDLVVNGGCLLINESRKVVNDRWVAGGHPFPEIATWSRSPRGNIGDTLTVCGGHSAVGEAPAEASFVSDFYRGMALEPGDLGVVLVRNDVGEPVVVAGEVGKGKVICGGFYYHPHRDPVQGVERQLVEGMFRWLA